jgi:hypothetical protein
VTKRIVWSASCFLLLLPGLLLAHFSGRYRPVPCGVSGSPIAAPYAGTLGALVTDGTKEYILSTATVLSDAWTKPMGTAIVQPAGADGGTAADVVAHLTGQLLPGDATHPGGDAALAEVASPGLFDRRLLLDDGSLVAFDPMPTRPTLGAFVEKTGRSTGFTTGGKVSAILVSLLFCATPEACHHRAPFLVENVFAIESADGRFSEPGDVGALVLGSGPKQPMGLLVTGSASLVNGKRIVYAVDIADTLAQLDRVLGRRLTFVGADRSAAARADRRLVTSRLEIPGVTPALLAEKEALVAKLMRGCDACGVQGIGIGTTTRNGRSVPAIVVYVTDPGIVELLPREPGGVPVRVVLTAPIQTTSARDERPSGEEEER